jgi:hypothetical protein
MNASARPLCLLSPHRYLFRFIFFAKQFFIHYFSDFHFFSSFSCSNPPIISFNSFVYPSNLCFPLCVPLLDLNAISSSTITLSIPPLHLKGAAKFMCLNLFPQLFLSIPLCTLVTFVSTFVINYLILMQPQRLDDHVILPPTTLGGVGQVLIQCLSVLYRSKKPRDCVV